MERGDLIQEEETLRAWGVKGDPGVAAGTVQREPLGDTGGACVGTVEFSQ